MQRNFCYKFFLIFRINLSAGIICNYCGHLNIFIVETSQCVDYICSFSLVFYNRIRSSFIYLCKSDIFSIIKKIQQNIRFFICHSTDCEMNSHPLI